MVVRPCCEPYDKWASRLRLAYSQRKKSARRKKGSAGSAWPTAATRDHHAQGATHNTAAQSDSLATLVEKKWPAPRAEDSESAGMRHSRGVADTLTAVTSIWPTPMAGTPAQNGNSAAGNSDFTRKAEDLARGLWATPAPMQTREGWTAEAIEDPHQKEKAKGQNGNGFGIGLAAQATALWKTPDVPNGGRAMPEGTTDTGLTPEGKKLTVGLENQSRMWPTPSAAQDTKGAQADAQAVKDRVGKHQIALADASLIFSRPDPETAPHGLPSSDPRQTWRRLRRLVISTHGRATWKRMAASGGKRRLNPNFVAWLMGWPIGHPSCACSETEWCLWLQHMRGVLSALPTASGAWIWEPPVWKAPEQMTLF